MDSINLMKSLFRHDLITKLTKQIAGALCLSLGFTAVKRHHDGWIFTCPGLRVYLAVVDHKCET